MKTYFDEHGFERPYFGNTTSDRTEIIEEMSKIDRAIEEAEIQYNFNGETFAKNMYEALQQAKKDKEEALKRTTKLIQRKVEEVTDAVERGVKIWNELKQVNKENEVLKHQLKEKNDSIKRLEIKYQNS